MADVLSRLNRARVTVGSRIAEKLARELDSHMLDTDVMSAFARRVVEGGDPDAIKALYGADIEHDAILSVGMYCDWAAAGIVRSGSYAARPFPMPDIATMARMAAKWVVRPLTLIYVIQRLREEDELPMLGRIDQGCLIPYQPAIDAWKAQFDWSDPSTP